MTIELSKFLARAEEVLQSIEASGEPVTLTRDAVPIAQITRPQALSPDPTEELPALPAGTRPGRSGPLSRDWEPIHAPGMPLSELVIANREEVF